MTERPATPPRKSLIVALAEAGAGPWTKQLAHIGAQMDGAIMLEAMRGFQGGYEACLKHGKRARPQRAFMPPRTPPTRRKK